MSNFEGAVQPEGEPGNRPLSADGAVTTSPPPAPVRFVGLLRADAYWDRLMENMRDSIWGSRLPRELPRVEETTVRFIGGDRELSRIPWRP